MNIYENPNGFIRTITIIAGLVVCMVAGHAQSILFLAVGLCISIFGIAWGCREYLNYLGAIILKIKDAAIKAISSTIMAIFKR